MSLLGRYVAKNVLLACLGVLLLVVGLDTLFNFIDEIEDLSDSYQMGDIGQYVLLTVPSRTYEFIPLSCLVGCLIGLGVLANNSELVVLRAAGVSTAKIVSYVMQPVILLIIASVLIGEYAAPRLDQLANSQRAIAKGQNLDANTLRGLWHREGSRYMHFNLVRHDGIIQGLRLYELDDQNRLIATARVEKAVYIDGVWTLQGMDESVFAGDQVITRRVESRRWQTGLEPQLLKLTAAEPETLAIRSLYQYGDYLADQGLDANSYKLAFWKKVLQPLAMFALVLVAISFIFGPLRSVTMGQRVMAGVITGMLFKFAQDLLGPASTVFGFAPLYSSLAPILICLGIGLLMLRRAG